MQFEKARVSESARGEALRWGNIVARPWGSAEEAFQGLRIGFFDEDGDFITVAIVEEDRMESGESQVKTLVWEDDSDGDPEAYVAWVGPEPGGLFPPIPKPLPRVPVDPLDWLQDPAAKMSQDIHQGNAF